MINELIKALYLSAVSLSGYSPADQIAQVVFITPEKLIEKVCPDQYCSAVAFYDQATETIYFNDVYKLKHDKHAQGFMVHEMVHYLQHKNGKISEEMSCEDRIKLEKEAYKIQGYFLVEHQQNTMMISMAIRLLSMACDE